MYYHTNFKIMGPWQAHKRERHWHLRRRGKKVWKGHTRDAWFFVAWNPTQEFLGYGPTGEDAWLMAELVMNDFDDHYALMQALRELD